MAHTDDEFLPSIVDGYAFHHPNAVFAEYPNSPFSYSDGFRPITYSELANAIHGLAWWLIITLGPPAHHGDKLAYMGPNDLRYPVLVLAAVKAGYCMFLPSPRNSVQAQLSLLDQLHCTTLLSAAPRPPAVTAIAASAKGLRVREVPEIPALLDMRYPAFIFQKPSVWDPLFVLHTSGSTGTPKPIIYTHEFHRRHTRMVDLPPPVGSDSQNRLFKNSRVFMTFPPFHAAGIASFLFYAISFRATIIFPVSNVIPTATGVVEALKQTQTDIACLPPSLIEEVGHNADLLEECAQRVKMLVYCGGDLPQILGDKVASKVRLLNQTGASELGFLPLLLSHSPHRDASRDWKCMEVHPDLGAEFRHVSHGQHELVMVRDPRRESHQPTFSLLGFTELAEYGTKDLYERHQDPTKQDMWRWTARKDDILVFLNGEKTNPITMEQHIAASNADVTGVLVVGAQRLQAALLVEAQALGDEEPSALLNRIWPSVEDANRDCPAHARIDKAHVLFTSPDKPMGRAGKGTIQRAATTKLYEQELDALYAEAENAQAEEGSCGPGPQADALAIAQFIRACTRSITQWQELHDAENFFIRGMDSLHVMRLARALRGGFSIREIAPAVIYASPSVAELTDAIVQLRDGRPAATQSAVNDSKLKIREDTLHQYQALIDRIPLKTNNTSTGGVTSKHHVLLTGSTGILGSYLLHTLLCNPSVEHIYCLNRRPPHIAQEESTKRQGASSFPDLSSRVTFLTVDLATEDLSLPVTTLEHLRQRITLVIHNAWSVNFNMPLPSFNPHLTGLVNLIRLGASASHPVHIFFISSVSSVGHYQDPNQNPNPNPDPKTHPKTIPEEPVTTTAPAENGYGESKYVAEHLLDYAARRLFASTSSSLSFSVARVGQVAGPVVPGEKNDAWNPREWFPSLVRSSIHVGCLPETLGPVLSRVDWVPVDLLSGVLAELALGASCGTTAGCKDVCRDSPGARVFHPHNLHPRMWQDSIRAEVIDAAKVSWGKVLETVSPGTWIARVQGAIDEKREQDSRDGGLEDQLRENPAAKLLDFYGRMLMRGGGEEGKNATAPCAFDTRRTARCSSLLKGVPGVQEEWVRKWVAEWKMINKGTDRTY